MKALISTVEPRETGYRIAQVEPDNNIFPTAPELFWVDCSDNVIADQFWYDPVDKNIKPFSEPELLTQPISSGTQEL